jgi:hypothetical protein
MQTPFLATVSTDNPSANCVMNYSHPEIQSNYNFTKYARHKLHKFCKDGRTDRISYVSIQTQQLSAEVKAAIPT